MRYERHQHCAYHLVCAPALFHLFSHARREMIIAVMCKVTFYAY